MCLALKLSQIPFTTSHTQQLLYKLGNIITDKWTSLRASKHPRYLIFILYHIIQFSCILILRYSPNKIIGAQSVLLRNVWSFSLLSSLVYFAYAGLVISSGLICHCLFIYRKIMYSFNYYEYFPNNSACRSSVQHSAVLKRGYELSGIKIRAHICKICAMCSSSWTNCPCRNILNLNISYFKIFSLSLYCTYGSD